MQTRKQDLPIQPLQQLTAPTFNFLRVNAQMHNLDKQKTAQIRYPLAVSLRTDISINHNDKNIFAHINPLDNVSLSTFSRQFDQQ